MDNHEEFLNEHIPGSIAERLRNLKSEGSEKVLKNKAGRSRLADTDKAKHITLRLSPDYLEKLEWVKGEGNGAKIRNLLDDFVESKRRLNHQVDKLKSITLKVYKLGESLYVPNTPNSIKDDSRESFLKGIETLKEYISIVGLSFGEIKKVLDKESFKKLELIFYKKSFLEEENK